MAPAFFTKLFVKSPQSANYEKLLTPSQSTRSSQTLDSKKSDAATHKNPSITEDEDHNRHTIKTSCVQICPHETLSFERTKRIVHLPYFKYSGNKIGAFTESPGPHHVRSSAGIYRFKPYPKTFNSLKATAFYKYQRGFEESYDGLVLCLDWSMKLDEHREFTGSVEELQRFLNLLEIQLCQHIRISDARIAARFYKFRNRGRRAGDPVEAYEEARSQNGRMCNMPHYVRNLQGGQGMPRPSEKTLGQRYFGIR